MQIFIAFLGLLLGVCNARPSAEIRPQNVVTVPPNCPTGQEWVNGVCRDIWRNAAVPSNLVTVPPNCPAGQVYVNGQCRDIWFKINSQQETLESDLASFNAAPQNVVTAPPNCEPDQQWVNGECRDIWRRGTVMPTNVVTVPPNCPAGQEYINGQCRDVWIRSSNPVENIMKFINDLKTLSATKQMQIMNEVEFSQAGVDSKNIISVPSQCPVGYKPDALGVCREIFN